jgi:hypothetical protein
LNAPRHELYTKGYFMKATGKKTRIGVTTLCVSAVIFAAVGALHAQQVSPAKKPAPATETESQVQARDILMRMAQFMARTQHFSVTVRGGYDSVQKSGQKIEFAESRKVTLSRPDRLLVEGERSDGAKMLTVFNGKEIMLIDATQNVYATAPQPGGVDETIVHFVRDLGMRLPLAVLLVSQLPAEMKNRVHSIEYVEKTSIYGAPSHHLAASGDTVDFQIWVTEGDKPLPQRIVITYREAPGQPEFRAQLSDWNLAPAITDTTFSVKPPDGAQKVAFAAQLPRAAPAAGKTEKRKGAK